MSEKKGLLMRFAQRLNGSARLEYDSLGGVLLGIYRRILQWMAMSYLPIPSAVRVMLLRGKGIKIGKEVFIGGGNFFDSTRPDLIEIEDFVSVAGGCTILTHSDPTTPLREILGPSSRVFAKVIIKRGAWVTVNCTILPGVTIGENSIIATGSVVNKDIPPNVIAGGMPARVIRAITPVSDMDDNAKEKEGQDS